MRNVYQSVVDEFDKLIAENDNFRNGLLEALAKRPTDNHWAGKEPNHLISFFREWIEAIPFSEKNMSSFYDYTFGKFYSHNRKPIEPAKSFVRSPLFTGWLKRFVKMRGTFMDSKHSTVNIPDWLKNPDVRIDDYLIPDSGFTSFNDFFTRRIKKSARPIDSPDDSSVLISPADANVDAKLLTLQTDEQLEVKGDVISLAQILDDRILASEFNGGNAIALYLDITDYHRFHSYVDGIVLKTKLLGGLYFGVNDFYAENHRGYYLIQTEDIGKVILLAVGIATISSVIFNITEGFKIKKGDELGRFAYGGSAILILFQPGYFKQLEFSESQHVLMGQKIGVLKAKEKM